MLGACTSRPWAGAATSHAFAWGGASAWLLNVPSWELLALCSLLCLGWGGPGPGQDALYGTEQAGMEAVSTRALASDPRGAEGLHCCVSLPCHTRLPLWWLHCPCSAQGKTWASGSWDCCLECPLGLCSQLCPVPMSCPG